MQSPPPTKRRTGASAPRTKRGESSLKRKALALALLLILASSLLNALFGDRGLIELLKAREELQLLQQEIAALETETQQLLADVRALKTSPLAIERLAREQLGMAKPDELILLIQTPESQSQ
jgi:cell division protein FtsB